MEIRCKLFNNLPWHTQKDIAGFFGRSLKTINGYLKAIENENNCMFLTSTNTEGARVVTRNMKFYSFDCVARLCCQIGSIYHAESYRNFLRPLGVVFPEVVAITCDEKNYRAYLTELFEGILDIRFEFPVGKYRVDGFVESLKVIFELDGSYHSKSSVQIRDLEREKFIKSMYPDFDLIRFDSINFNKVGNELITRLLKAKSF